MINVSFESENNHAVQNSAVILPRSQAESLGVARRANDLVVNILGSRGCTGRKMNGAEISTCFDDDRWRISS